MNSRLLTWIAVGLFCVMQIIVGCGDGGGGDGEVESEVPSNYTEGNITVSFMEASHTAISKLKTYDSINSYKYRDQEPMTKSELSALKSKLNGFLGTKFTEDAGANLSSKDPTSNQINANVLFKNAESEDKQALKVNPYSRGFVFHRSQAEYLMPTMSRENGGGKTKAVLTWSNAPRLILAYLKNSDLMPEEQYSQLKVGKVSGIGIGGEDSPRIITVYFIRELSGYPVVGNTRIVVSMTADGELVSLVHKWPNLEEMVGKTDHGIANNSIVTGMDAVNRIGELFNNYYNQTKVDSIDLRRAELVMYDDGKHIEPAFFASGDVNIKNGDIIEHDWIIPLLKSPNGNYEIANNPSQTQPPDSVDEGPVVVEAPASDPIPDPDNPDSGGVD
jgi:hypothetical protein